MTLIALPNPGPAGDAHIRVPNGGVLEPDFSRDEPTESTGFEMVLERYRPRDENEAADRASVGVDLARTPPRPTEEPSATTAGPGDIAADVAESDLWGETDLDSQSDASISVAAGRAGQLLGSQADRAGQLLGSQADRAGQLLGSQADRADDAAAGRPAVLTPNQWVGEGHSSPLVGTAPPALSLETGGAQAGRPADTPGGFRASQPVAAGLPQPAVADRAALQVDGATYHRARDAASIPGRVAPAAPSFPAGAPVTGAAAAASVSGVVSAANGAYPTRGEVATTELAHELSGSSRAFGGHVTGPSRPAHPYALAAPEQTIEAGAGEAGVGPSGEALAEKSKIMTAWSQVGTSPSLNRFGRTTATGAANRAPVNGAGAGAGAEAEVPDGWLQGGDLDPESGFPRSSERESSLSQSALIARSNQPAGLIGRGGVRRLATHAADAQSGIAAGSSMTVFPGGIGPAGPAFDAVATGLSSAPTTPPGADLGPQLVKAITLQWQEGGGDARLRLHPEHLGEVLVSLQVRHGAVTAVLQSGSDAVRGWIRAHQQDLKNALSEQGLTLAELIVDDDEHSKGRPDREPEPPPRRRPRRPASDISFEVRV